MIKKPSLRKHILIYVMLAVLLPSVLIGGVAVYFSVGFAQNELAARNNYVIGTIKSRIDEYLTTSVNELRVLRKIVGNGEKIDTAVLNDYMKYIVEGHPQFVKIEFADASGIVKHVFPPSKEFVGVDVSGRAYFRQVKRTGKRYWAPSFISPQLNKPVATLSIPLGGHVLTGYLSLEGIGDFVKEFSGDHNITIAVTDQTATYIAHTDYQKVLRREIDSNYDELLHHFEDGDFKNEIIHEHDGIMCNAGFIAYNLWAVSLYQPSKELYAPAWRVGIIISSITAAVLILAMLIFYRVFSGITSSLQQSVIRAKAVALGDYQTQDVDERYAELHDLASNLNIMSATVQEREIEIGEKDEYNKVLFNEAQVGLALCKKTGELVDINPAYAQIIGRSIEDTLKLSYWDITPQTYEEQEKQVLQDLESTGHYGPYEKEYMHKNGSLVPVRLCGVLITIKDEEYIWSSVEDISEHKFMEERVRQSDKMQAVGQLAGGVAHDFNNMLAGIMGYAEILSNSLTENPKLSRFAGNILKAAQRSAELTDKLLAFSRKGKFQSTPIDVHKVIEDALDILSRSIDRRIQVKPELFAKNATIVGDPSAIQNVILNLGVNARDAMPNGGVLSINTAEVALDQGYCLRSSFDVDPGEYIQVTVTDTGVGMSAETMARVFEPFFTTKGVGEGTGLGLSAAYGSVIDHHGEVKIYSEVDHGTSVTIFFPLSESSKHYAEDVQYRDISKPFSGSILLIDDEEFVRNMAVDILGEIDFNVITAVNGEDGVDVYKKNQAKVDLVILDVVMPVMNGRDCFYELRKINPDVKIIISSGFPQDSKISQLFEDGLCGYIKKPFSSTELLKVIHSIDFS